MLCLIYTHDTQGQVCIYQESTSACVITIMLHFWHSKIHPNLKATAQLAYIVTDTDCDNGSFNDFIMFPNVSMTYPIPLNLTMGLHSHSYGVCIKAFMAINGEEFRQMRNQW